VKRKATSQKENATNGANWSAISHLSRGTPRGALQTFPRRRDHQMGRMWCVPAFNFFFLARVLTCVAHNGAVVFQRPASNSVARKPLSSKPDAKKSAITSNGRLLQRLRGVKRAFYPCSDQGSALVRTHLLVPPKGSRGWRQSLARHGTSGLRPMRDRARASGRV
jgi:hypothetical protein